MVIQRSLIIWRTQDSIASICLERRIVARLLGSTTAALRGRWRGVRNLLLECCWQLLAVHLVGDFVGDMPELWYL